MILGKRPEGATFQELFSNLGGNIAEESPIRLRVLSLSCVFPNRLDPHYGNFVRSRLQALAELAEVQVFAPIPLFDWGRRAFRRRKSVPPTYLDGKLAIHHPRWFYPPAGGGVNAVFLFLRLIVPLRVLRRQWRFDLIDAHFAYPEGIAAALLSAATGVPFSITMRGNEVMHAKQPLRRMLIGWALRRASAIITVSESLRNFALDMGVPLERLKVIPNGVHAGLFFPQDREFCRRKIGLQPGQQMILSAGSLIERKGHHHVVQALEDLPDNVQLFIAGGPGREGDFEPQIRRLASTAGLRHRVRMLSAVTPAQMAELMSAADLLCLASSREGWPNVVHEAMACGTPVVATAVGGVPEMMDGRRCGILVPPNDQTALIQGLRDALHQDWDRQQISTWAHSRSWDTVAREVLMQLQKTQGPKDEPS
jgi:glycosyltransferase involved in cell wall biosynthesis